MNTDALTIFISVCNKPRMYVQSERFEEICAYIEGYNEALWGAPLEGFREWLLTEGTEWTNMCWWALIRKQLWPVQGADEALTDAQSELARKTLSSHLSAYIECRRTLGLAGIYDRYSKWLVQAQGVGAQVTRERLGITAGKGDEPPKS